MFERIKQSWDLVAASARVLKSDKKLVLFPILSATCLVVTTASFAVPVFASGVLDHVDRSPQGRMIGAFIAFLFYLIQYTVIFFANSALVGAALIRLRGGTPTLSDGLRIAWARFGAIFGYALISATVGMILRSIARESGIIGRIVVSIMGAAWNVTTYLVVPVIVSESAGPAQAMKRSADLLKKTFGEQIIGNAGIGLAFGWLFFATFLVGGAATTFAAMTGNAVLIIPVIALLVLWFIALCLTQATLSGIYAAAVYRYASEGNAGADFDPALVQRAFRRK
jgi:hypothetical protein